MDRLMTRTGKGVSFVFAAAMAGATVLATMLLGTTPGAAASAPASAASDFLRFPDTALEFIRYDDLKGWTSDDHAAAFAAFRASCEAIRRAREVTPARVALKAVCREALAGPALDEAKARAFFEREFQPVAISALGKSDGFLTGYFEPVIEGSRIRTDVYTTPVYGRPADLVETKGGIGRRDADGRVLPAYYDRAEIETGALEGRMLAICWIKDPVDLFFAQIQGSVKVHLADGGMMRLNYDGHNGWPYAPVGRFLIDEGVVARADMSLERIRRYMHEHPDEGAALRRRNRSYVFFRETGLAAEAGPVGAQGISLTAGRSIAVDKNLHAYGTPFFIEAALPLENATASDTFQRLMIAQDTGSAIVGPARADIYFGAGAVRGLIAGRIQHRARFTMLVPRTVDFARALGPVRLPRVKPEQRIDAAIRSSSARPPLERRP